MINLKLVLMIIAGMAVSTVAQAQGYLALGVGFSSLDESQFDSELGAISTDYDGGVVTRVAGGYQFASFRGEIELAKYENDVDSHSIGGSSLSGPTGETPGLALMVNGYYDFATTSPFIPYIGFGVGNIDLDFSSLGVDAVPNVLNADDSVFAYQLMLGGTYALSPSTSIFGEYRYINSEDATVQTSFETGGVETGIEYQANVFQVGVKLDF